MSATTEKVYLAYEESDIVKIAWFEVKFTEKTAMVQSSISGLGWRKQFLPKYFRELVGNTEMEAVYKLRARLAKQIEQKKAELDKLYFLTDDAIDALTRQVLHA